ncbi:MAG: tetratricopeptide repeat protein [Gemmatimonadetes bacterium]|nr:tetratricopeptide repeat protein [Gemmatimonadota bacterium]
MRTLFILAALVTAAAALPCRGAAQPEPPRPGLPRGADPNDWEVYFDEGNRLFERFPARAGAAFYWAARLDPTRAEPLFAQWAAFYARSEGTWLAYLQEDAEFMRRPDVIENETLVMRAFRRNPFVHRGFEAALYAGLGRRLRWDGATTAFMDYGKGDFRRAADGFGRLVRANPVRNARFRQWRALAFVGAGQLDSAAVELTELLATLRREDTAALAYYYESKALQEYALGMLHEARGRPADARRAWERALEEDLSMYPARAALGRLSLRERKAGEAVEHLTHAVEAAPRDAVMHYEHGNALIAGNRRDDAIAAYQRAIQLEPHFADPYLRLGIAFDNAGEPEKAAFAYRAYLDRAPRRQAAEIRRAHERLAALAQAR